MAAIAMVTKVQKNVLNPPSFFVSMATAAKFIQPIPIFLAYLAPLDVDVVSYQVSSISVWQVTFNFFFILFIKLHETLQEYPL
jgi:hypothetical protein